jgi:hypothetical protein
MSYWWRTVEANNSTKHSHLSCYRKSAWIQCIDIFIFLNVWNLLEKQETGCRAVCTKFQMCVCVCVRAIGTAPESITEWSKAHPFGEMEMSAKSEHNQDSLTRTSQEHKSLQIVIVLYQLICYDLKIMFQPISIYVVHLLIYFGKALLHIAFTPTLPYCRLGSVTFI